MFTYVITIIFITILCLHMPTTLSPCCLDPTIHPTRLQVTLSTRTPRELTQTLQDLDHQVDIFIISWLDWDDFHMVAAKEKPASLILAHYQLLTCLNKQIRSSWRNIGRSPKFHIPASLQRKKPWIDCTIGKHQSRIIFAISHFLNVAHHGLRRTMVLMAPEQMTKPTILRLS